MKEIHKFFIDFLDHENDLNKNHRQPNIDLYNNSVEGIAKFTSEEIKFSFGAKLVIPYDEERYERYKSFPPSIPRFLYKIEKRIDQNGETIYVCFASENSPEEDWKELFLMLIAKEKVDSFEIICMFNFTESMEGDMHWFLSGGSSQKQYYFHNDHEQRYELSSESLGDIIDTIILDEPSDSETSMEEFNKEL